MNPELRDPSLLKSQAYVSGKWCEAESGMVLEVHDPADGAALGTVPSLSAEEVARGITTAEQAMARWKKEPALVRSRILNRWFDLIVEHTDDLAAILTAEQG